MDWTKLTKDPCDVDVQLKMHKHLQGIREIQRIDYMSWLLANVRSKSCLDIGAIEHDLSYTEKPSWKFKQLMNVTSKLVGVDILEKETNILRQKGFDIRVCDATSDVFLGEKFEVVVLGDVIEHVSNPINLIKFAIRHLAENGSVIVKTPNVYYIDNVIKYFRNKDFVNFEHIAWFTPTMALEIARRAGCNLKSYIIFPRKRPWSRIFSSSDIFTRDYVFIFSE